MKTATFFEPVAEDMRRVEEKMRHVYLEENHDLEETLQQTINYLVESGGKRIRPALVLMGAQAVVDEPGKTPVTDKMVSLAAAVEMLHTATLVHDDLIDNSMLRRGVPTLNSSWSAGATILTGDYVFARSAELAAQTDNPRVISIFSRTLMTICSGELQQIFGKSSGVPTLKQYYSRIYAKTASLFAACTQTAAILNGAAENVVSALYDYGKNLGMAFQVIDDVLDFIGDSQKIGKPVGNDLREGIITLPAIYFFQDEPSHPTLSHLAHGGSENGFIEELVGEIRASGTIERAVTEARGFASLAKESLKILPDSEYSREMYTLADFTVDRKL